MVCQVVPRSSSPLGAKTEARSIKNLEVADYETALDAAGYGKFSRSALGACACAFFTTGVQNCVMGYALPAARHELHLTTYQAGLINMAFMCGGVASAFFWGIVGDVFGRRKILSLTLLLDSSIMLLQSAVPDYRLLLFARTVNGFLIGGPSTLVFTYLSDLVGPRRRQLYLDIIGMSFVAAWLVIPAYAWMVIPFRISDETLIPLHSWRLCLALSSIPGLVSGIWILFLPESPRLLADTNRADEALELLKYIHKANGSETKFKIRKLLQDNLVTKAINHDQSRTKSLFIGVMKDLKSFISKAYIVKSSLILFVFFANMAAGFGLNLWIPELLLRMQKRDCTLSSPVTENFTIASNVTWTDFTKGENEHAGQLTQEALKDYGRRNQEKFIEHIDDEVFTSGMIVGAICVIGNAACIILCSRGGAKGVSRSAAACALTCALACLCLSACACACSAANKMAVAAAAMLNAASLNGNVLLIRLLLHALPPKLSGLGICWGAWWGRAGGVASNLAVGALLDYSCPAPFIAVATLLLVSIGAIVMIKIEKAEKVQENNQHQDIDQEEKNTGLDRYISTHM